MGDGADCNPFVWGNGNNYKDGMSWAECKQACIDAPEDKGFECTSVMYKASIDRCWLRGPVCDQFVELEDNEKKGALNIAYDTSMEWCELEEYGSELTCSADFQAADDFGGVLKLGGQTSTLEECKAFCSIHEECTHFYLNDNGSCYMYTDCSLDNARDVTTSGVTYMKGACPAEETTAAPEEEKEYDYIVHDLSHCSGSTINTWEDGTSSGYGGEKDLATCMEVCDAHDECAGFVLKITNGVCGYYKSGPLNVVNMNNHKCYEKIDYIVHDNSHCYGTTINSWADGTSSGYGGSTDLATCVETCDAHDECAGFVLKISNGVCAYYKSGPLAIASMDNHKCYEKPEVLPAGGTYNDPLTNKWSTDFTSDCNGMQLIGGYPFTGTTIEKTYNLDGQNCEVTVELDYMKIDSWDNEWGRVYINGVEMWSNNMYLTTGYQQCGQGHHDWNEEAFPVSITFSTTTEKTFTLTATAEIDGPGEDESFGIGNVVISTSCDVPAVGVYEDSLSGWNTDYHSYCGDVPLVGGFAYTGTTIEKTYQLASTNCEITVDMDYWKIDSWDAEVAQVLVNGNEVWSGTLEGPSGTQVCGEGHTDWYEEYYSVSYSFSTGEDQSFTLTATAGLDTPGTDESFGVANVVITTDCAGTPPTTTLAPTTTTAEPTTTEAPVMCVNEYLFESFFGDCSTYAVGGGNYNYCDTDTDQASNVLAMDACPGCGVCTSLPKCVDELTWESFFGDCSTYVDGNSNKDYCDLDTGLVSGDLAQDACPGCGVCGSIVPPQCPKGIIIGEDESTLYNCDEILAMEDYCYLTCETLEPYIYAGICNGCSCPTPVCPTTTVEPTTTEGSPTTTVGPTTTEGPQCGDWTEKKPCKKEAPDGCKWISHVNLCVDEATWVPNCPDYNQNKKACKKAKCEYNKDTTMCEDELTIVIPVCFEQEDKSSCKKADCVWDKIGELCYDQGAVIEYTCTDFHGDKSSCKAIEGCEYDKKTTLCNVEGYVPECTDMWVEVAQFNKKSGKIKHKGIFSTDDCIDKAKELGAQGMVYDLVNSKGLCYTYEVADDFVAGVSENDEDHYIFTCVFE